MKYTIAGTTMQTLSIDSTAGENLYSQTASMAWMSDFIEMKTSTGGGLFSGLKRSRRRHAFHHRFCRVVMRRYRIRLVSPGDDSSLRGWLLVILFRLPPGDFPLAEKSVQCLRSPFSSDSARECSEAKALSFDARLVRELFS